MSKTDTGPIDSPESDDVELEEIPEIDFLEAMQGVHRDWYERAKGHFYEVTDDEDAKRKVSRRRPRHLANLP